ncbi:hypothetical protein PROFUN_00516 [Planoprotostelium fungivorum]|uniref:EGF-like domain-containing protein n=1 Tax=Planoprotostelium fungivorum TaxID=1890364 RepID=A0A2P6N135_9EUKA|nr:hypothetical protein PROFUN_00516 [Planoprotostelium fungivorum]
MRKRALQVLILLLISLCLAQAQNTTTNGTISVCGDCNENGVCQTTGTCRCYPGFISSTKAKIDCASTILSLKNLPMRPLVVSLRVETTLINFVLWLLISWRLFLDARFSGLTANVVAKLSLLCIYASTFLAWIMHAFDYWGTYGLITPLAWFDLNAFVEVLLVAAFCGMVLHWINLYNETMKTIRKREMLKKINSSYVAEVSLEDIIKSITFLSIFRVPYIAVTGVTLAVWIARCFVTPFMKTPEYAVWYKFVNVYLMIVWGCFAVAFGFYGYRLLSIMPETTSKKIKQVTWKLCIVLGISSVNALIMILLDGYQPVLKGVDLNVLHISKYWVSYNTRMAAATVVLDIHMPLTELKKWFSGNALRTSRTGASQQKSNKSGASEEIETRPGTKSEIQHETEV